ncbi:MAG: cation:proton antiporter [Candidatus Marinimicrobia bacterium]|nr:cation:proton antiporter [Candidatus Neomarinimicrobiota bacterium]
MKLILIVILTILSWFARSYSEMKGLDGADNGTLVLGLLLVSALVVGKGMRRINIPMLSGFILYGIIAGPYVLNIITVRDLEMLRFTDFFALSLIAITAGGELRIQNIRKQLSLYLSITLGQFFLISIFTLISVFIASQYLEQFSMLDMKVIFIIGLVLAVILVANSPATAIAIIKEQGARGKNTDLLLGVAVFKDIFIILIFAVTMAVSASLLNTGSSDGGIWMTGLLIGSHIFYSILIGIALGILLILGIKYFKYNLTMIIVLAAVSVYIFVQQLHLEAMLTCMVAGFTVQNFSQHGEDLIQSTERSSMPFYIIFFTLAGVKLDFGILAETWPIALSLVALRIIFMMISTSLSVRFAGGSKDTRDYLWMGYLAQAGVSLGLVSIFQENFSTAWANEIATILIAVIAVNQIIGPIMLKLSLQKLKEIPK